MNTTGEKIKEILHEKRLTQGKLAEIGGTSRQNIANYVSNLSKPNWEFLININKKLDVNLNWFIADDGLPFKASEFEQSEDEFTQKVIMILKGKGLI